MKVKGPDGKIYNFPDGTEREKIIGYFRKNIDPTSLSYSGVSPPSESVERVQEIAAKSPSSLEGFGRGLADPVIGGAQILEKVLPEPISSLIREPLESYGKSQRAYDTQRREAGSSSIDIPRAFGNVLNPINLGIASKVPFKAIPQIGAGASMGLLTPLDQSLSDEEFMKQKLGQGALGGALGGALPAVSKVAKTVASTGGDLISALGTQFGINSGDRLARNRLLEALAKDKTDPVELLAAIKQANDQGFPQSAIDVVGPNVRNLAERTVKRSNKDYVDIVNQHRDRLEELPVRSSEYLKQELVESSPEARSFLENSKAIDEGLKNVENYFSKQWATQSQPLPENIKKQLSALTKKDPDFKEAVKRAREITEGRDDLKINKPENGLAFLYYVKKGMDSYAASGKKAGYNPEVADRIAAKSDMLDSMLRELSPDYSTNMGIADDLLKNRQALELGKSIYKTEVSPELVEESLSTMAPQQREYFLSGVRESALRQAGKNKEPGSFATTTFGTSSSDIRQKMGATYGSNLDPMLERLGIYDTMAETSKAIPGLAHNNPISAILDPEARDFMALAGTVGRIASPLRKAIGPFVGSKVLPAKSAGTVARSVYGPLSELESLMQPVTSPGFIRRASNAITDLPDRSLYAVPGLMPSHSIPYDEEEGY